jgi:protein-tyrosine phosphatase
MLVLAGLGVRDEVIAADYGLTEPAMRRMMAWAVEHDPDRLTRMAEVPPAMFAARPAAISRVLEGLRRRYGSPYGYLSSIGVGTALLADLADQLTTAPA